MRASFIGLMLFGLFHADAAAAEMNASLSPALLPAAGAGVSASGLHRPPSTSAPGSVLSPGETPQQATGYVSAINIDRLATLMSGAFSNEAQARSDSNYHDVVLHVVRIWIGRTDGPWLYAEQALAHAPTQPYRQQVYQLAAIGDGSVEVRVFKLPDPIAMTAAWRDAGRFNTLSPDHLAACKGCALQLKTQPDGSVKGATEGCTCPSELSGAAYATTELTVSERELVIWDRGFTAAGAQVWGPAFSGYVFTRVE